MRLLAPQILSCEAVERYDIWVNTTDTDDLAFLHELDAHPKVNLIPQPDGHVNGNASINAFFLHACEPGITYIRFDDDIVWMEEKTIQQIADFRESNPRYFLVALFIVNNALCTAIFQARGTLHHLPKVTLYCMDQWGWCEPRFAEHLHRNFIAALESNTLDQFRTHDAEFSACRFSINCISWLGEDLEKYSGIITGDEEETISALLPLRENRPNCLVGGTLVSHFSFFTQRDVLDATNILDQYRHYALERSWIDPKAASFVEAAFRRTVLGRSS